MHRGGTGSGDLHWAHGEPMASASRRDFRTLWDHLVVEDRPTPADAILCFGSRYPRVTERAAALFGAGVAPWVVVSGGPGSPGSPTEADLFAADLEARGVPAARIVVERRARHTGENVVLGIEALRPHVAPRRLVLVAWPLAARRARATAATLAPAVVVASAPALVRPGVRWHPTWRRIGFALGELDRLAAYGARRLLAPEPVPAPVVAAADRLRAAARDEVAAMDAMADRPIGPPRAEEAVVAG